jgi:ABC-type transport system involved in multi-copper enzyme maturation permease subunit
MLKTIIAREFLNNILDLRFIVSLVLCIVITIACVMILVHDYQQQMKDYYARVNIEDEILDNYAPAELVRLSLMVLIQKPPERFRPLIIGIQGNEDEDSFDYNPLPILFPALDFLFIVTIIMSLLAMLFSHDAIAGERQNGTLRLMISNSISRTTILFGKFIGGSASLIIPFILVLLAGVLYISVNPSIQWDGSVWLELALLTAASITFITLFYLLGLLVSSFSRYSSTSILNCLFLWVMLILVVPNVCTYISAQLCRIPSIKETETKQDEIKYPALKAVRKHMNEAAEKFRLKYGGLFSEFESMEYGGIGTWHFLGREADSVHQKAAQQRAEEDPEFKAMMDAFRGEYEMARKEFNRILKEAGFDELGRDLGRKSVSQTKLAKNLACISPFANFVYIARDLTGTGLRSLDYFERIKEEYEEQFQSYAEEKISDARKKNPAIDEEYYLDVRDRPRFVFKEEALKDKLGEVLPYWGILVLFNVVFFAAAFTGFMRYDVR